MSRETFWWKNLLNKIIRMFFPDFQRKSLGRVAKTGFYLCVHRNILDFEKREQVHYKVEKSGGKNHSTVQVFSLS